MNPWFWPHFLHGDLEQETDELLVGIGTLINDRLPIRYKRIHIMGSGAGYGDFVPEKRENWEAHFVRGPLTAKAIGLGPEYAITDPAILLSELIPISHDRTHDCVFMPHLGIDSLRLRSLVEDIGMKYVSPKDDVFEIIEQVNTSERLICSAMHGAILAEALRVPWYPVSTSKEILEFKWIDWASSVGIDTELDGMPSIWPERGKGLKGMGAAWVKDNIFKRKLEVIRRKGKFTLAREDILEKRRNQMKEVFLRFNQRAARSE